ncbi:MAG: isochorismate synthase [Acidimicrobiaceae bacterium]
MPEPIVARTRRLDADLDLAALAGSDGVLWEKGRAGFAGRGAALRVPLDAAADALAAIEVDDDVRLPGTGPVAFGAVPFVDDASTQLVVPAQIWGRADDGTRWHTVVGPKGALDPSVEGADDTSPTSFRVEPSRSPGSWCELVELATKTMADGPMAKVVLAREVIVTADADFVIADVVSRLRLTYPGCHVFSMDGFVGASPELLVSRAGDVVRSHPMAGTAPRGGDPTSDARLAASLLASSKDRAEHQLTIDMVHDTLLPWCSYLDYEAEPSVVPVANVQHLATLVEGRLSDPAPSVLELVRALHPTPAVCGTPREVARAFIAEHEGFDRGRYAGTVGWVDAHGNGAWAVSIRCASISGATAKVYAGNGIVADSDPSTELAETRSKLQAMLSALVRP